MKVRIYDDKPSKQQRKALHNECVKEFDKLLGLYNRQVALQVLYTLRFDFGFGQERLRRFSERLKELRVEKGITRQELAEALFVSVRLISYWENGLREPKLSNLIILAKFFEVSIDKILSLLYHIYEMTFLYFQYIAKYAIFQVQYYDFLTLCYDFGGRHDTKKHGYFLCLRAKRRAWTPANLRIRSRLFTPQFHRASPLGF